ncbi:MAG: ABC transporter substrate-binding protein [Burkholderiaceae bacterium]|nr:ABC transporter substrate-binding protein [Burkholderiaceae bacterium]
MQAPDTGFFRPARLVRWTLALFAACALFAGVAARAAEAPNEMIHRLSDEVLGRINADPALKAGDSRKIDQLVDGIVMPHVDFQRMTALAVGRSWRDATPAQRQQLMDLFRTLLIRTYSGALSQVGDQKVRMKPFRADPADTDVIVRSEVLQPGREPAQLDYRLRKVGDAWKIYDVNVLGVWLVETYRTQFAQEASAGGVEALIRSLQQKNEQLAAGSGKAG